MRCAPNFIRSPAFFWLLALLSTGVSLGETNDPAILTLERIITKDEFKPQEWGPARWLKDGSGYTTLEKSAVIKDARDVVRVEPETGQSEVLVAAADLIPSGKKEPLKIEDYAWSDDTRKLLIFTNRKRVWRRETRGDYWVWDRKQRQLHILGGKAPASTLMFAQFSPDGTRVAYVSQNNLYVQSLETWKITALTHDGSETIINGTSDWVYEEEFGLRNGFRWSPDQQHIAYWQFNTTAVPEFKLINYTDSLYPKVTSYGYPKVGQTNSACRVGVVSAAGGPTRWFLPEVDSRNNYIPQMEWAKDSQRVFFQRINREQNTNQVLVGNIRSGRVDVNLTERDDAWVDVREGWDWAQGGRRFLWLSERDGWNHLYSADAGGAALTLLTPGDYDVLQIVAIDEVLGCVYFIASPDKATERYLFRAPLDGGGWAERMTPAGSAGCHSYDASPDGKWAFHTFSRFGVPPVTDLVRLSDHLSFRTLADNAVLKGKLADLKLGRTEFFRVAISNRVELDGWCIFPPDFDPARKYPVLFHVYGEPAGTTVVDRWGGGNYLWHSLLAQRGYVVMSVDNRGTPAPRGREWRKSIYRQIGILASEEQANAVSEILKDREYLDPKRVGVWGWSGGGSMSLNAIFRHPDLYQTAMAVAFVANQRYYDTVYQERYMSLPDKNPDGFRDGSPITFASQLKGNLLLVYGTGDDNCHFQNCEALVNELVRHNKKFSLMTYPNRTHAISEGENTKRHLYETLTRYLEENLPATPGPSPIQLPVQH
jgi:dipeptidyl-peptidase-4